MHKLKQLNGVPDLLYIANLDEETLMYAKIPGDDIDPKDIVKHLDCFGAVFSNGDKVILVKTLDVREAILVQ